MKWWKIIHARLHNQLNWNKIKRIERWRYIVIEIFLYFTPTYIDMALSDNMSRLSYPEKETIYLSGIAGLSGRNDSLQIIPNDYYNQIAPDFS